MPDKQDSSSKILTIPNILTLVRFALIPVFIRLYVFRQDYVWSIVVAALSGITDIADGVIARRFNMVTDIGKIIDPIADKLTQAAIIFCLSFRYPAMRLLFIAHAVKEIIMAVMGIIVIRRENVQGAKWFGKLSTVVLFTVTVLHLLIPTVSPVLSACLVGVSMAVMLFALVQYALFYYRILNHEDNL